ncbi:E3 ubiquitin-protein ligase RNF19B-like isoform X2 [Dreissena polymorpha]|nr:E3 ubiquitin-protein ligase RNF19B-like isoform X2 [Dreissena polymorpha]
MIRRHDSEVISTTSSTSKTSERRKNRFSLRRIFYAGRSGPRTRSRLSLNSSSSAHSDYVSQESFDINRRVLGAVGGSSLPSGHSSAPASRNVHSVSFVPPSTVKLKIENGVPVRECPLCLVEYPVERFPDMQSCEHRSCLTCLQMYLRIEISESRINIACPECLEKFHPNDIKMVLQDESLLSKYEDFMVRRVLVSDPDARWCPAPDCGYAVIATECAGCPKIKCERPGCNTHFCYHCKQYWHPNKTCDAARSERVNTIVGHLLDIRNGSLTNSHESDSQKDSIKPCPRCSAFIMKMNDGSCNHMTCPVCGAEFCWLCMKEISDLHYLSPSGCTFWGKKPWSRKKKILWQLGTLVGAPVGITLLAGIAVPAMVIGIPVWVGKKIHTRLEHASKHRHNLAIVGGVTASILLSPLLAGLAVGIGVPILLGYVYGVVPISLCRSGGCGVRTTDSGVRIEFEENENETGIPSPSMYSGAVDSQSVGTGHQIPNPSIAPSIGEFSVGMNEASLYGGSGTQLDRLGASRGDVESDMDSASHRAIAGASLNGSMCGSTYATVIGMQTNLRLEVQAELEGEVLSGKRASFSSVSGNFSIGEKSMGGDDVSTRALAGSIINYKLETGSLQISDVQVDVPKQSACGEKCLGNESDLNATGGQASSRDQDIASITSRLSNEDRKRTTSCPGSPHSTCGSVCEHEEGARHHSLRCRKCRRLAKQAEKHSTEHMNVHFSDQVSLQSFQADDLVLDLPMGKHDIDSLSATFNEEENDEIASSSEKLYKGPKRGVCRMNSEPAVVLTEIESDKPVFSAKDRRTKPVEMSDCGVKQKQSSLSLSQRSDSNSSNDIVVSLNSSSSAMSMKYCKYEKSRDRDENLLSKCRSEEIVMKKKFSVVDVNVGEKSRSEEIYNKEEAVMGGGMRRTRRESCELALQDGRISPSQCNKSSDMYAFV